MATVDPLTDCRTVPYSEIQRQTLFRHIPDIGGFLNLDDHEKLKFLLNDPTIVKQTAKYIVDAYEYRSTLLKKYLATTH